MKALRLVVLSVTVILLGARGLRAELSLIERSDREATRAARFQALSGSLESDQIESIYQGSVGGRAIFVNSMNSVVTGNGPYGGLQLTYLTTLVTGQSGPYGVRLNVFGNVITGVGPRGAVYLTVNGRLIRGRIGNHDIGVQTIGSRASGFLGSDLFNLVGYDVINPVGLACFLACL